MSILNFGSHPAIQTINPDEIKILAKAKFAQPCCPLCYCGEYDRMYIHVLENAIQMNYPFRIGCVCCTTAFDAIYQYYYDRGPWDTQSAAWQLGCVSGEPSFFANNPRQVCCCVENDGKSCLEKCCPQPDYISYIPFETYFCCCTTRATPWSNCFGLCGPATGQPLLLIPFAHSLEIGSAQALVETINNARAQWKQRTGKN